MTKTAKTLVFVNLVLSVVFVAWAVGLVTNQVPWHTPPVGDGPKVEGMVAQLQTQIKKLTDARNSADPRWGEAYLLLIGAERQRVDAQKYYADLLRSVRTGDVPDIKPPVQQLVFNGPLLDIRKRSGRPAVAINGEDALSIAGYHAKIQQTLTDIQSAQTEITGLLAETDSLTKQINGFPPYKTQAEKGLRIQIRERQELVHALQLEQQYLRSPLTYFMLQRDQLRQRQAALIARLSELKGTTAAAVRRN
jgi:signal transduction histidine kinase